MKTQYKVAVCSFITIIISAVVSFFFVCFKDLYIEKWFEYLIAISLGLLTNSVLIFTISIFNFHQIRRENSRRIFIELNIFQEEYAILNALMLPFRNDVGEISIPDSEMHTVEKSLARLDDISLRILFLDRISQPTYSLNKKHSGDRSRIAIIENSFFKTLSEFIHQCHIANNAFRLSYGVKDESTRKLYQISLQNSISKIIEFSNPEGEFDTIFKSYLEINKKILKITSPEKKENVTNGNRA